MKQRHRTLGTENLLTDPSIKKQTKNGHASPPPPPPPPHFLFHTVRMTRANSAFQHSSDQQQRLHRGNIFAHTDRVISLCISTTIGIGGGGGGGGDGGGGGYHNGLRVPQVTAEGHTHTHNWPSLAARPCENSRFGVK